MAGPSMACDALKKEVFGISNSQEASTDSNVFLEIFGADVKTGKLSLNNSVSLDKKENLFEKGKTNIFEVEGLNVGKILRINIGHDGANTSPNWELESIKIEFLSETETWTVNKFLDKANNTNVLELKSKNEPNLNGKHDESTKKHNFKHILTAKEISKMEGNFNLFSKGASTIKKEEALKVIQSIGQNPSKKEFNDAFNEAHLTQDNLTINDIKLLLQLIWNESSLEGILKEAFKKFDKDETGFIDEREFKAIMMKTGERLDESEFKDLMALVDKNNDGFISYAEFVRIFSIIDDN